MCIRGGVSMRISKLVFEGTSDLRQGTLYSTNTGVFSSGRVYYDAYGNRLYWPPKILVYPCE